jgi:hypothetical protein
VACSVSGTLPDYFVTASRVNNRDELSIIVVSDRDPSQFADIQAEIERVLNGRFGLKIGAAVVRPGEIDHLTEFHTSPKLKRFKDERGG